MMMRNRVTAIVLAALLAGCAVLGSMRLAHAATEPALYIYHCFGDNIDGGCIRFGNSSTPPFESCPGWAGWAIPRLSPDGGPYTFQEVPFGNVFGAHGKQCLIAGRSGGFAARAVAFGECQTPGYTLTGSDPLNLTCVGASTIAKPTRQLGPSDPCCGDPINPAPSVGNNYEVSLDYLGTGPFPLKLERYYNSAGTQVYPGNQFQAFAMANWRHSYERRVLLLIRGSTSFARVDRKDGNSLYYTLSVGNWTPEPGVTERLEQTVEGSQSIWKFTNRDDEIERYDVQTGRLLSITNRAGLSQVLGYDALNRLSSVTDPFGRTLTFSYGAANCSGDLCVASVQDPGGNLIQYGYDTIVIAGNNFFTRFKTVTYPGTPTPRTYNYDNANLPYTLLEIIDENDTPTASWTYDNAARGTLSQRAGGVEKVTVQYLSNVSVQITSTVSSSPLLNRVNTYQFETIQGIQRNTSITGDACPSCGQKAGQYDVNGYLSQTVDWNNNLTTYLRQDAMRPELETQRVGASGTPRARTITTQWHSTFRLPTLIAEPGRTTSMGYDAAGNLLTRTITDTASGNSRTWTYTYNANGQVLTVTGPRTNNITTYTYHANNISTCSTTVPGATATGCRGQLHTITNALSHVATVSEYNAHGQPLSITDPNGLVTTLAYDLRQRLTSRNVGGEITLYEYDGVGQLKRATLADGSFLQYTYDNAHRLTEIADNLGDKIVYTLDAVSNRVQERIYAFDDLINPKQSKSREYSNLNRLIKDIGGTNPFAQVIEYTLYDGNGNLKKAKYPHGDPDPLGNEREYGYDELNRLITVTDPKVNGTRAFTQYGYNALDQLTSVTDPRNLVTSYNYNGLNNLISQVSPDTGTTSNTLFDEAGNLRTQIDAKGQSTTFTYDELNRVKTITYQGGVTHTYQYDQGTNGKGRLTQITEPNSATQYVYDQKGRLTTETRTINAVPYVTSYSYDSAGRLTGMIYPGGRRVTYTFDALGRIQQIATTKGGTAHTVLSNAAYRPFGPPRSFTFGNGQTYTRGFDQDGRMGTYTLGARSFAVGYDAASRVSFITDIGTPANSNTYGYDNLDRLTNAVIPGTPFAYSYDAVGNRATQTVGANTYTLSYGSTNNRLSSTTGPIAPRSFTYDANGSVTGDGAKSFAYDPRGRMTQAISVAGTTNYQVNSLGQRIRKMNPQGDTVYHYDAQGRLIAESSPGGQVQQEYIYLNDIPVAVLK